MNASSPLAATPELPSRPPGPLYPIVSFALANVRGIAQNWIATGVTMLTPLLLLLLFWATSLASAPKPGEPNIMLFMIPAIVAFTVIQSGGPHAITIVNWREQGIFRRLACTPVPLWQLVLGRALAQLVVSLLQGALILLVGMLLVRLPLSWSGLLLAFGVLAIASACFIALGSLIAGLFRNALVTNAVYMFILIPMMFVGDFLMPTGVMPGVVQRLGALLPPAMVTALVRPLLTTGALPPEAWQPLLGLGIYSLVFIALSVKLFRWE